MKNGGPAFPTENERQTGPNSIHYEGMTLRDYFAAKAMAALVTVTLDHARVTPRMVADDAYLYADAMMAARGDE